MAAHTDGVRPPAGFGPVLHYGWVILIVSFVIHLLVGVERPIFGGFFSTWKESFGWSAAAISLAASINVAVRGVAGPFTGNMVDRLGPRRVVAMYTIILAVSLFGMSRMNQLWQLYLFYGVMAGLASSLSVAVPPLIVRWFRRGTTLALSVPTTGMLVGQAGLVPLLTLAYLAGGWRLPWLLLGLADVALLLIVIFGIRDNPSVSEGRQASEAASVWAQSRGVGLGRACGTSPFWLMATAFFSCGFTINFSVVHIFGIASEAGLSTMKAAQGLSIMGLTGIPGLLLTGVTADRLGRKNVLGGMLLLRLIAFAFLIAMLFTGSEILLYTASALIGVSWLSTGPPVQSMLSSCYGFRSMGTINGVLFLGHQMGGAIAIYLGGFLSDATGSYLYPLIIGLILLTAGSSASFFIRERPYISLTTSAEIESRPV